MHQGSRPPGKHLPTGLSGRVSDSEFADRVMSAMRFEFRGHEEKQP